MNQPAPQPVNFITSLTSKASIRGLRNMISMVMPQTTTRIGPLNFQAR